MDVVDVHGRVAKRHAAALLNPNHPMRADAYRAAARELAGELERIVASILPPIVPAIRRERPDAHQRVVHSLAASVCWSVGVRNIAKAADNLWAARWLRA